MTCKHLQFSDVEKKRFWMCYRNVDTTDIFQTDPLQGLRSLEYCPLVGKETLTNVTKKFFKLKQCRFYEKE